MKQYQPLFVTNTARSGSYLISMMLSANRELMVASEPYLELFRSLRNTLIRENAPSDLQTHFDPSFPMQDYYFTDERIQLMDTIQAGNLNIPFDESEWETFLETSQRRIDLQCTELKPYLPELKSDTYQSMFDRAFEIIAQVRQCEDRKWVGIKDAWTIEFFTPLAKAYPEAHFIIILRDPRAIINSMLGVVRIDPNQVAHVISYARHWRKYAAFTRYFQQHPLFKDRLYVLTHEQVLENPEKKAREMCEFLGVEYDPVMLNTEKYYDYATGDIWKGNSSFEQVTSGISLKRAERWKTMLDPTVLKVIEWMCDLDMQMIGYSLIHDEHSQWPETDILKYFIQSNQAYCNWRSDLEDPQYDYGFELFRKTLLDLPAGSDLEISLIRRSFLFENVYEYLTRTPIQPIV